MKEKAVRKLHPGRRLHRTEKKRKGGTQEGWFSLTVLDEKRKRRKESSTFGGDKKASGGGRIEPWAALLARGGSGE